MIAKETGISLLKMNLLKVEAKFRDFFQGRDPRWPSEKHDYLRNHHKSIDNFSMTNVTMDKLDFTGLPETILAEIRIAFDSFEKGEEYH